jgi:caffeoyl-CoA O-methyltransferase
MKKQRGKPEVTVTNPEIEDYSIKLTSRESAAVQSLVSSSENELEFIDMICGNLVGELLRILVKVSKAKDILEIGTFTGYSALVMAEALPKDGTVTTIEMNIRYQKIAEKHFASYDSEGKVRLIKGDARDEISKFEEVFDLVFIDADKMNYSEYCDMCIDKIKSGGLIVVDNVLWDGLVLNPQDEKSASLHRFNKKIAEDERVEQVVLPFRDGVSVIMVK